MGGVGRWVNTNYLYPARWGWINSYCVAQIYSRQYKKCPATFIRPKLILHVYAFYDSLFLNLYLISCMKQINHDHVMNCLFVDS